MRLCSTIVTGKFSCAFLDDDYDDDDYDDDDDDGDDVKEDKTRHDDGAVENFPEDSLTHNSGRLGEILSFHLAPCPKRSKEPSSEPQQAVSFCKGGQRLLSPGAPPLPPPPRAAALPPPHHHHHHQQNHHHRQ
ncbi:hypothetical protein M0802_000573 [Mischocyttarus mexicanus]|nr:hypothetical protein M0802_000573 [Mischocyttarus mexicanus]